LLGRIHFEKGQILRALAKRQKQENGGNAQAIEA